MTVHSKFQAIVETLQFQTCKILAEERSAHTFHLIVIGYFFLLSFEMTKTQMTLNHISFQNFSRLKLQTFHDFFFCV